MQGPSSSYHLKSLPWRLFSRVLPHACPQCLNILIRLLAARCILDRSSCGIEDLPASGATHKSRGWTCDRSYTIWMTVVPLGFPHHLSRRRSAFYARRVRGCLLQLLHLEPDGFYRRLAKSVGWLIQSLQTACSLAERYGFEGSNVIMCVSIKVSFKSNSSLDVLCSCADDVASTVITLLILV